MSMRAEGPIHCRVIACDGSGFQPFAALGPSSWGGAPGWYGGGPLALSPPSHDVGYDYFAPKNPTRSATSSAVSV